MRFNNSGNAYKKIAEGLTEALENELRYSDMRFNNSGNAYKKIAEGLTEALSVASGQATPSKIHFKHQIKSTKRTSHNDTCLHANVALPEICTAKKDGEV